LCRIDEGSGVMDGDWGDRLLLRLARMVDEDWATLCAYASCTL
jgi:hypothetical protein